MIRRKCSWTVLMISTFLTFVIVVQFRHSHLLSIRSTITKAMKIPKVNLYSENKAAHAASVLNGKRYFFNCSNIDTIQVIKTDVGGGRSKTVDIGIFNNKNVVIKRLSLSKGRGLTPTYRELLFIKEILIRDQLDHPSLIKMLGYCVRSLQENSYKKFPRTGDITAVYEFGKEFNITSLTMSSFNRVRHAINLVDLLQYFEKSPLGSLIMGDIKDRHFLMVDGVIKLIDFDYVHNIEAPCNVSKQCGFNLKCSNQSKIDILAIKKGCVSTKNCFTGICTGYNAAYNFGQMNKVFLRYLLNPAEYPLSLEGHVGNIYHKLKYGHTNASSLSYDLKSLMNTVAHVNSTYVL